MNNDSEDSINDSNSDDINQDKLKNIDPDVSTNMNADSSTIPLEELAFMRNVPDVSFDDILSDWKKHIAGIAAQLSRTFNNINPKDALESALGHNDYVDFARQLNLIAEDLRCNRYEYLTSMLPRFAMEFKSRSMDMTLHDHGLLLHGGECSGCTPTMCNRLAYAFITVMDLPHYFIKASDITSDSFDNALPALINIFAEAEEQAPCVIYIEDLDKICRSLTGEQYKLFFKSLASLMVHAVDRNIFILATSFSEQYYEDEDFTSDKFTAMITPGWLFRGCGLCSVPADPDFNPEDFC